MRRKRRSAGQRAWRCGSVLILTMWAATAVSQPSDSPPPSDAEARVKEGARHYRLYCTGCHGWSTRGDGPMARSLELDLVDFRKPVFRWDTDGDGVAGSDTDMRNLIANGAAAYRPECARDQADENAELPASCMMPAFSEVLEAAEIDAVIAYLRAQARKGVRQRAEPMAPKSSVDGTRAAP